MNAWPIWTAVWLLTGFGMSGCQKKQVKKVAEEPPVAERKTSDEEEASLRGKDYAPASDLKKVYFQYDSSSLGVEARRVLAKNAEWIRRNKNAEFRIDGHCDERGTTEYNLGLGQRRAAAVRDYYKALGVQMKTMATLSYGKEKPVCMNQTEECWERNRRAETLVKHSQSQPTR